MKIDLDREGLEALVKGSHPNYNAFNNPLTIKAGHLYRDQYGSTEWRNLESLNEEELFELYIICRNSWV